MPFELIRNDITKMNVDAIVNSANPRPIIGGGVDGAIHRAAGAALIAARRKIGDILTGEAFITLGFDLPAHYVIHTVGPVWQDGKHGEPDLLRAAYLSSLRLAREHGCKTVAFPLISAGIFGCPVEAALETAVGAISEYVLRHDMTVYLVVFDRKSFQRSGHLFDDVRAYIDENYAARAAARDMRTAEEEPIFEVRRPRGAGARPPRRLIGLGTGTASSLGRWLGRRDETFSERLIHYIDAKGFKDPEVYKRANIDRKLFSKIRSNSDYQPRKSTALALSVALRLSLDETRDLLERAGYALSHSSKADLIVEYFITREKYDIFIINQALFSFEQPTLGS
ncbi:macro domain-containing protein [Selenomonas artemidis]|uniref:macro domain-containing protein n=1 Tax=Selenomonas artemidis TaxID=671224 RepID=UPI00041516CF|nr:macro domain-containing protein [Selenomonas artemidis]